MSPPPPPLPPPPRPLASVSATVPPNLTTTQYHHRNYLLIHFSNPLFLSSSNSNSCSTTDPISSLLALTNRTATKRIITNNQSSIFNRKMTPNKPISFSLLFFNESTLLSPPFTNFLLVVRITIAVIHILSETQLHVLFKPISVPFLVHRSRTLRQLKELAFIKSGFNSLKSSISTESHFDFKVVSHKAMDLLLKLDSIQGGDPMIRDGKRNVRALGNTSKARALNAKNGYGSCRDLTQSQKEIVEKLRKRVEKISGFSRVCENDQEDAELEGFQQFVDDDDRELDRKVSVDGKRGVLLIRRGGQPSVTKAVSFSENGNSYRVISDTDESAINGDGSSNDGSDTIDDHGEAVEIHFAETGERKGFSKGAENDQEAHLEDGGGSAESSDSERNPRRNPRNGGDYESNGYCLNKDGSLVFSAPVPVKMESRADMMKKRKAVKIVT
ncbi:hypothetical protein OIU85_007650 [Salix viminalis]|uniref:Uncharacterized protein n=1 Tax=Salix viminalis TaxID=40686 RepID=A0A9Q0P9L3_SALVM|nr:hypothetical protein OIU85_007650 [Salix viminalis]